MKTSIILPIFALAARVLADLPPACLLNAVNTQQDPSDLSAVCGDEALDVQEAIASMCNSNAVSAAQSAFIATCSGAGSSVAPYTATATTTSSRGSATGTSGTFVYTTAVYNSDCSCTTTIVATATSGSVVSTGIATSTGSSDSSSATGGSGASASGNAAADTKQVGSFVAVVIAIAGVVAVL